MRKSLLAPVFFCAALAAQTPSNLFEIYSGCTNYTSRGSLGTSAGEVLTQIPFSHISGLGQDADGNFADILGFRYVTQAQNAANIATYSLVLRAAHASEAPDCSAAGLMYRHGPLSLPSGFGTIAWQLSTIPATPLPPLPVCRTYFMGAELAAAPAWTTDGQSFHIGTYYLLGGTQADNPGPGAPNLAWDCVAGNATQPTPARCMRFGLLTQACVLNVGNVDPTIAGISNCVSNQSFTSWGAGGLWPECGGASGRNDGISIRVRDINHANGAFLSILSIGQAPCPGISCPPLIAGRLLTLIPPASLWGPSGSLDADGQGIATVLTPGSQVAGLRRVLLANRLDIQAFAMTPPTLPVKASNRAGVTYLR